MTIFALCVMAMVIRAGCWILYNDMKRAQGCPLLAESIVIATVFFASFVLVTCLFTEFIDAFYCLPRFTPAEWIAMNGIDLPEGLR